ncbi:MAG: hypothetical protein AB1467_05215 [Candidatus Diapherotrites archaeon]
MPPREIIKKLRKQRINTTVSSVWAVKSWMRREGIELPRLPASIKKPRTILIEEVISDNLFLPSIEIKKMLEKNKRIRVKTDFVTWVRSRLRKAGIPLPYLFERKQPKIKIPKLSKTEEKKMNEVMPNVTTTLRIIRFKHRFTRKTFEEFRNDALLLLPY